MAPDTANKPTVFTIMLSKKKPTKTKAIANPLVIILLFKEKTPRVLNMERFYISK
jgi:hypothetical protein